jgi:hypothetical protein
LQGVQQIRRRVETKERRKKKTATFSWIYLAGKILHIKLDAHSYFVGSYIYGCRLLTKRQPINQPEKIKLLLASFSFSPLTYSRTNYIIVTILLAHERFFNSFVRNNMISNLTRLNQLIAKLWFV